MTELTDTQIDDALERGRTARSREPRAVRVRNDRQARRVLVELADGCTCAFLSVPAQGLGAASEEQLAKVEVLGAVYGLDWEALDPDLSVPDLLTGLFGTRAHMPRQVGKATSTAKAVAPRANGVKGGRLRQVAQG